MILDRVGGKIKNQRLEMPNKVGGQGLTDEAAMREASQVAQW